MAEMSLERACEWMNKVAWDGVDDWEADRGYAYSPSRQRRFTAAWAIAEAAKFATHLAAPPAERAGGRPEAGQLSARDLRSQVLVLAELKPGWYDGEGGAFDAGQLAAVADVLDRLVGLAGANAYPMPNGRISVEWHSGPRSDSLEIDPHTLAMRMHLYDLDSGETIVGEIAPESLLAAAERGAGAEAGPATREIIASVGIAIDASPRGTAVSLHAERCTVSLGYDMCRAALRELNMEPPR